MAHGAGLSRFFGEVVPPARVGAVGTLLFFRCCPCCGRSTGRRVCVIVPSLRVSHVRRRRRDGASYHGTGSERVAHAQRSCPIVLCQAEAFRTGCAVRYRVVPGLNHRAPCSVPRCGLVLVVAWSWMKVLAVLPAGSRTRFFSGDTVGRFDQSESTHESIAPRLVEPWNRRRTFCGGGLRLPTVSRRPEISGKRAASMRRVPLT